LFWVLQWHWYRDDKGWTQGLPGNYRAKWHLQISEGSQGMPTSPSRFISLCFMMVLFPSLLI
jgi:hypothetical protein